MCMSFFATSVCCKNSLCSTLFAFVPSSNQVTIVMWAYSWLHWSICPFLQIPTFLIIENLEVKYCHSSSFVLQYCVGFSGSFAFPCKLENQVCRYPLNNLLGFWKGLQWTHRFRWNELTSWQYWIFLYINMEYLSIYF